MLKSETYCCAQCSFVYSFVRVVQWTDWGPLPAVPAIGATPRVGATEETGRKFVTDCAVGPSDSQYTSTNSWMSGSASERSTHGKYSTSMTAPLNPSDRPDALARASRGFLITMDPTLMTRSPISYVHPSTCRNAHVIQLCGQIPITWIQWPVPAVSHSIRKHTPRTRAVSVIQHDGR